jgi:parallel beta-helix repeat protein
MDDSNTIGTDKKVYYLKGESNLLISPDTFPDVGFLALVACSNVTVYDLDLSKNGQGLILASTTGTTIAQCDITYSFVGVMLFASSSNVLGENTITNNERGIQFSMLSNNNNVFSNVISDNRGGLFLYNSSNNLLTSNNITDNTSYGIGFSASSYNIIRNNYFINNPLQVIDSSTEDSSVSPSINTWSVSFPVGGNYWSDYTGIDVKSGSAQNETGSDNFGDTPYVINSINKDLLPLMPFGSPPAVSIITPENKTYSSTSISLNYDVSEAASWVGYSLDSATNVSITGNTTLSGLSAGAHSLIVYVEDVDGNQGASEIVYFTIAQGGSSLEAFPEWILTVIILVVVATILFFFVKIIRKK